jgi:hypothetical protein
MAHKFEFFAVNGMDKVKIEAYSIELVCEDGSRFELYPRRSDGEVVLYAKRRLVIRPKAANCAGVSDEA